MKKAQSSFFVILGLLLIMVMVLFYGYMSDREPPSPVPQHLGYVQGMVEESVTELSRECSNIVIRILEDYGGYPNGLYELSYLNRPVNYWQVCQNDVSPNIEKEGEDNDATEWMESGIEYCVELGMPELMDGFAQYGVSYGNAADISVDAKILDDRIDFDVRVPVTLEDEDSGELYPVAQPLDTITIPTYFGRIFSFGKDFVAEYSKPALLGGRFFEVFTILSIYHSRALPTVGVLTKCGETIFIPPVILSMNLMQIANYVLSNTHMWKGMAAMGFSGRSFGVKTVNGNRYPDLEPQFLIPDDFYIRSWTPVIITNSEPMSTVFPFIISDCVSTYHQTYSVSYPVIVRVEDTLLEYAFNFGVFTSVENMFPAQCMAEEPAFAMPDSADGGDLDCGAEITVTNSDEEPLQGASVLFNGIPVGSGVTDDDGSVSGAVSCGEHTLGIYYYNMEYGVHEEQADSDTLSGTYVLMKNPEVTYHFRDFDINVYTSEDTISPCLKTKALIPEWSWKPGESYDIIKCVRGEPHTERQTVYLTLSEPGANIPDSTTDTVSGSLDCEQKFGEYSACIAQCEDDLNNGVYQEPADYFSCIAACKDILPEGSSCMSGESAAGDRWTVMNTGQLSEEERQSYDDCVSQLTQEEENAYDISGCMINELDLPAEETAAYDECMSGCSDEINCKEDCEEFCENPENRGLKTVEKCQSHCIGDCSTGCSAACTESLLQGEGDIDENTVMDYITAGTYDTEAMMFTLSGTFKITGGFLSPGFGLAEDADELYVNVPEYEGTVMSNKWDDSVKECLAGTLAYCGIDTISEAEPPRVVVRAYCDCASLLDVLDVVESDMDSVTKDGIISNAFCDACPGADSYPGSCGCQGCRMPEDTCVKNALCDADAVKNALMGDGIELICR